MTDHTIQQWLEGEKRAEQADPARRIAIEHVIARIVAELRRRLGGAFTTDELISLYEQGTAWCLDLAHDTAPGAPWAWDARVFDAAFARYLNGAVDFAGGRRVPRD
ncbi:MAG TPA: hypothetical protein VFZ89_13020 [Solirubrobacteraceae bacterium]